MKKFIFTILLAASVLPLYAAKKLPALQKEIKLEKFRLEKNGDEKVFELPSIPGIPGMIPVLRCRMFSIGNGGCNYCVRITFNDTPLGALTAGGRRRLLFRDKYFHLNEPQWKHKNFRFFNGSNITLPFAHSCNDADKRTTDKMGSLFYFDISDAARIDVNTMTFRNIRANLGTPHFVSIEELSIGYLPVNQLPANANRKLDYSTPANKVVEANGVKIDQFSGGGFAVSFNGGKPLVAETAISMDPEAAAILPAKDRSTPKCRVITEIRDKKTLRAKIKYDKWELERTLRISDDGRVDWFDCWSNTGKEVAYLPFRYRVGLANNSAQTWLRGSPGLPESIFVTNPTIFFENAGNPEAGCGLVIEDTITRFVLSAVSENGVVDLFSNVLVIAPGKKRTFHFSIQGSDQGGYWHFINALRKRWNIGLYGVERPFFWAPVIPSIPGKNADERIQHTLGSLGPISVAITPWLGRVAGNPEDDGSGRTITEIQRENHVKGREKLAAEIRRYKRLLPNAKVMSLHHPSMYQTYMPDFDNNPLAVSAIRNADGSAYHHLGYDSIILKDRVKKGWKIIYYLPLPGTPWYDHIFEDVNYLLDNGSDGCYFDEFSFCTPKDYRRYDYSSWDGFSADVDENGKIIALKSDNAYTTEAFKSALVQRLTANGKLFLGNGGDCTRVVSSSAGHGFMEGTALVNMGEGHLLQVPLVLGNYGDENSSSGVMQAVRDALKLGCIYSPHIRTNLVISGEDNFVCKLYPVTVVEIGPGFVAAKERLIAAHSGTFRWQNAPDGEVTLYIYDHNGTRIKHGETATVANESITLQVPENGLVIAELNQ